MRILLLIFSAFLCLASNTARAEEFFGTPVILVSGVMMLQGHNVTLWGIDMLAPDQQCWQGNVAWDCGQEAMTALRHHTEGRLAHCVVQQDLGGGSVSAQCFLQGGPKEEDVAQYLVAAGWARDQADVTDGLYVYDEDDARTHGRGVWTSKFQSAEDWKNGVQRFVVYDKPAPPAQPTQEIITTVTPAAPMLLERQRLLRERQRLLNHQNDDDDDSSDHKQHHHDSDKSDQNGATSGAATTTGQNSSH